MTDLSMKTFSPIAECALTFSSEETSTAPLNPTHSILINYEHNPKKPFVWIFFIPWIIFIHAWFVPKLIGVNSDRKM